tara:strand:+ start:2974 stop:3474 length:501 start_codon:yes stop_codon:yes gene_type:complete
MAIRIKNLEQIAKRFERKTHIYKDWHFDFAKSGDYNTTLGKKVDGNDLQVDYDELAIRNSLRNLFNTRPGQRFLFPLYGLDLYQYLFESITPTTASLIGNAIVSAVKKYEPRVALQSCNITPNPDENTYEISLVVELPSFNTSTTINSSLDVKNQTFIFIDTSRNR